jgi:hypothetical protein
MSKIGFNTLFSVLLSMATLQALAVDVAGISGRSEPSRDLNFLVGNWESTDPAVHFNETWVLAGDNQLKGFRVSDSPAEYSVFVFEPNTTDRPGTAPESHIRLRRMTSRLRDLGVVSRPVGEWKLESIKRCLISFEDPTWSMSTEYISHDPNQLDLEIEIKQNEKVTKRFIHLRKV